MLAPRLTRWPRQHPDAGAAALAGKLTVATHRQVTLYANGGWIIYVVASNVHRDIAFSVR